MVAQRVRDKWPTRTVEIECVVSDPAKPSYFIDGVRQRAGDRTRTSIAEAERLMQQGKAHIFPDTEREEMI